MKTLINILFTVFTVCFLVYLAFPTLGFPNPPAGAVQSKEPADTEYIYRRAYFTNMNRDVVVQYYKNQMAKSLPFSPLRLNYPPEDAQTLIRDQTRSTFLEETTYPLRDSIFINGFKPVFAKDDIFYKGIHYEQKVTIRYVPSRLPLRILMGFAIIVLSYLLFWQWVKVFSKEKL